MVHSLIFFHSLQESHSGHCATDFSISVDHFSCVKFFDCALFQTVTFKSQSHLVDFHLGTVSLVTENSTRTICIAKEHNTKQGNKRCEKIIHSPTLFLPVSLCPCDQWLSLPFSLCGLKFAVFQLGAQCVCVCHASL